jgi:hypothetical protein
LNGGRGIDALAKSFGIAPEAARPAVASLVEALTKRATAVTLSRGGVADFVALLAKPDAGKALANAGNFSAPDVLDAGNDVLAVLNRDKHISRGIAASAARAGGIDVETAKKMLPAVASMMIGAMQKETAPQVAKLVRDIPELRALGGRSPLPMPGEVPMDSGGDTGSWGADEQPIPRGGPISGGSPLPIPGDDIPGVGRRGQSAPSDNPFENLPDIIRRGGVQVPGGGDGGGALENVIRSILGGLLGFGNRGTVGTIVQMFILRWVMNLVRRVLARGIGGR